ncbi:MAG: quinoprotein dehydrogenase-associated SoxYZ-like carrier [Magnetovibrionaceae bacterium]
MKNAICAIAFAVGLGLTSLVPGAASADRIPSDPYHSPMWEHVASEFLPGKIVMSDKVKVFAPADAEDNFQVPIAVDATELGDVEEIVLIADQNPIPGILRFLPKKAKPYLATRIKLNEASVVHAAARTTDGTWHVGGVYVDAAGGGCTAPAIAVADGTWADHLNEVQARVWSKEDGSDRMRFRIIHPMDTGLSGTIPAFYLDELRLADAEGNLLAEILPFEPVSENPVFTLEVAAGAIYRDGYGLEGRDNNGNTLDVRVNRSAFR